MKLTFLTAALGCMSVAHAVAPPYKADFSAGVIPAGIEVLNSAGILPDAAGYKRGWTDIGWTVDRYGSRGYVALSPTYTNSGDNPVPCRNVLALPELTVREGDCLSWQALSVHPDFPEAYRVVAAVEGLPTPTLLFETDAECSTWTTRMVDLSIYAGKAMKISFVCESADRYMLALDAIAVDIPAGFSVVANAEADVYYGRETESAPLRIEALNTGSALRGATLQLACDGKAKSLWFVDGEWATGEYRTFEIPVPMEMNEPVNYSVSLIPSGTTGNLPLCEGTLYRSAFKKRPVVDEGTGMWCVNCPDALLDIDNMHGQFGDALITLATHTTSGSPETDILANGDYFAKLAYRAVPRMMLNRINATTGVDTRLFTGHYYTPAEFGIAVSGVNTVGADDAEIGVEVRCAEATDNNSDRYRVGYVLTADFHDPSNIRYSQRNNLSKPAAERFYFLPSKIPAPLCVFHDVTLTAEHAFDGFEGSLPAMLEADIPHSYVWRITRPEQVADINDVRVVAFVLDTESGEILAADAVKVADMASSGCEMQAGASGSSISLSGDHTVVLRLSAPGAYTLEVFDLAGAVRARFGGIAENSVATHGLELAHGVYLLRLQSGNEILTQKITL